MGPTREMMPYGKFWSRSTWIIFTTVMAFTSEREREEPDSEHPILQSYHVRRAQMLTVARPG